MNYISFTKQIKPTQNYDYAKVLNSCLNLLFVCLFVCFSVSNPSHCFMDHLMLLILTDVIKPHASCVTAANWNVSR